MYENSFTHGIRADCRQMVIRLKAYRRGENICFVLTDDGRGMSQERLAELYEEFESQKPKSIGLANVNRRLVLRYGQASALNITSKENKGTTIRFAIPTRDPTPEAE
jgi:sensor histidine kinase YesM